MYCIMIKIDCQHFFLKIYKKLFLLLYRGKFGRLKKVLTFIKGLAILYVKEVVNMTNLRKLIGYELDRNTNLTSSNINDIIMDEDNISVDIDLTNGGVQDVD